MGAVRSVGRAIDPTKADTYVNAMTLGKLDASDLDPTYRKGALGGALGGKASLGAEAAARSAGEVQAVAQQEAAGALTQAYDKAGQTLDPLAAQAMPARDQQAALMGLGGDSQAAYDAVLNSPQFIAQQDTANRQLERRANVYGSLVSGDTLSNLGSLNAQLAGNAINQQIGQLQQYAQPSIGALSQQSALQGQLGQGIAGTIVGAADARANAAIGAANANTAYTQGLMNLGGTIAGGILCDQRLKENIKKIGMIGPYNWYSFNYKGTSQTVTGPMAQEVEAINPDAIFESGGFKAVNLEVL